MRAFNCTTSARGVAVAMLLNLVYATQPAWAETRAYVINLFVPAMNNKDDSDCPHGKNPIAPGILEGILRQEGVAEAQIQNLLKPGTFDGRLFDQYATYRGKIDGEAVNVYHHPLSVPDPHIKLSEGKEAFGFNLDGQDGQYKWIDPLTGEKGVNNAAARVFGCFDRTRGTFEAPPTNWSVRWGYYNWGHTWLLEVKADNFQNADHAEINFYRGVQPPAKNSQGFQRYMTYEVDPDPRTRSNRFHGKIHNGMFVSDASVRFWMISSPRLQPEFDFKAARLRLSFKPDGSIEGFLGGFLPITMVYFPFGDYASGAEFNGGMDIPGVYYALKRLADTDIDKDPKTAERTRISQTYQILAVPAFLAGSVQ